MGVSNTTFTAKDIVKGIFSECWLGEKLGYVIKIYLGVLLIILKAEKYIVNFTNNWFISMTLFNCLFFRVYNFKANSNVYNFTGI